MTTTVVPRSDPIAARPPGAWRERSRFLLSFTLAAGAHAAMALGASRQGGREVAPRPTARVVIDIEPIALVEPVAPVAPPIMPMPDPAPQQRPPPPGPARTPARADARRPRRTAEPAADGVTGAEQAPVDFTGSEPLSSSLTTGRVGGVPAASGTAPRRAGPRGGEATMPGPDRSRRASLEGTLDWSCPFPPEAEVGGVDTGVAVLRVAVRADGRVGRVQVLRDPGHGFGRAGKSCAMARRFNPAQDRDGRSVPDTVVVQVRFVR